MNPAKKRKLLAIGAAILPHRYDLLSLLGLLALVHGIAMVWKPAAWIVGGVGAIVVAILAEAGTRTKQQEPNQP
jgi:hypothetical protein